MVIDVREYRLSKKTLYLWFVYAFLIFGLTCLLSVIISYFLPTVSGILMLVAVVIGLFAVLFYLPALWRGVRICVSDRAISYTIGLFMRREHILPLDRMLFMQKVNTPVSALFHMCSLHVKALGGYLLLPPMETETAEEILARCSRRR